MTKGGTVEERVYPFSVAERAATCPDGHPVTLATGYSVFGPNWWIQWGVCQKCHRGVERTVGMPHGQFAAGPVRWAGEESEEGANWKHDVLDEHRCERCRELAQIELAQSLLTAIERGAELVEVVRLLEETSLEG